MAGTTANIHGSLVLLDMTHCCPTAAYGPDGSSYYSYNDYYSNEHQRETGKQKSDEKIQIGSGLRILGRILSTEEFIQQVNTTPEELQQDIQLGISSTRLHQQHPIIVDLKNMPKIIQVHSYRLLSHTFDWHLFHRVLALGNHIL